MRTSEQETARNPRTEEFDHTIVMKFKSQRSQELPPNAFNVCTMFVLLLLQSLMETYENKFHEIFGNSSESVEEILRLAADMHRDTKETDFDEALKQLGLERTLIKGNGSHFRPTSAKSLEGFIQDHRFMAVTVYGHTIAVVHEDQFYYVICSLEGKIFKFEDASTCAECIMIDGVDSWSAVWVA